MALIWYINRKNIATEYCCYVEGSSGLLDMPKAKTLLSADINDFHGESVNADGIRYQPRDIVLSCFCIGTSIDDFNNKINALKVTLTADDPIQLTITGMSSELSYMVICQDGFLVEKQWKASGMTIGTFQLKLREPCPIKRILKYVGGGAMGITIPLGDVSGRIYWGDGEYSSYGDLDNGYIVHNYAQVGTYYIVITGYINPNQTPNYGGCSLVWELLI